MPAGRRFWTLSLKLVFSFSILLYLLLKVVPVPEILEALERVSVFWLLCSFSLHALGLLISAVRWKILIRAQGDEVPLGFLAQSYLVGNFFNLFLPTRFGGDVVRIWDGSRYSASLLKSSAIVLVERFTGVVILLALAFGVSLVRIDMARRFPVVGAALIVGFLGLFLAFLFITPLTGGLLERIPPRGFPGRLRGKIQEFRNVVLDYRKRTGAVGRAFFWAFLLQVNVILHYFLAGKAFHLDIPLMDYFVFIPIVLLILTIPVTIGGLGLREVLYIEIFAAYGITGEVAFSFSLLADIAFTLIIGLLGGLIYALRK
ncbi:MAG: lysylphosphatidylglycerol synthase transmembrane domain-containing protein [Candidatus Aminicenantales bacterium]